MAVRSLSAAKRFLSEYLDSGASQYAGMLAFSLFVAMVPLTLGVLDFWGLFVQRPRRGLVAARQVMIDMFPPATQGAVRQVVLQAGDHVGAVALFALIGLVWFSTGVFSTIGFALNRIHGMPNRPTLQQRLRGLWLPLALVLAAYVAVVINIAVRLWSVPAIVVPVATWFTLVWLIGFLYRLAPSRMLTRAELMPGACLAALIIVGLGYAFPYYTELTGGLNSGSRFFTVLFGLVAWVYGIAHAVLIGAVFNRARMAAREDGAVKALAAAVARER
jgi:YihY family inner membrane protein